MAYLPSNELWHIETHFWHMKDKVCINGKHRTSDILDTVRVEYHHHVVVSKESVAYFLAVSTNGRKRVYDDQMVYCGELGGNVVE